MQDAASNLIGKIQSKKARIGIVGMGYVGLPLAVEFWRAGFNVSGFDVDADRVASLNAGSSYIPDIPTSLLSEMVRSGRLLATSDPDVLKSLDVVALCVPTPLRKTKDPDLSYVLHAVEMVRRYIDRDKLIVLESTTYPGTTDEVVLPMLEESGFKAGRDFFLAFSPERVDPGNKQFATHNTPKIVSGITPECTRLAQAFYEQIIEKVIPVSSTKVAETVKLLENTFRSVNIGLVNEIALMCHKMGIDVWEVIDAAATKPFGFLPFYPGPGIGGHCIPVDPLYLSWKAKQKGFDPRFIDLASQINGRMPEYVIEKIAEALNERRKCLNGSKMLIVGVAYKKDINDIRESPALDILSLLVRRGVEVSYHDPYVSRFQLDGIAMESQPLTDAVVSGQDCVIIVTDHSSLDYRKLAKSSQLIMDTRNALKGVNDPQIIRL